MIKVIAMDIDGTLVNKAGVITQKTKEALLKAQENGCLLVLASGRPINGMLGLAKELEMDRHHGLCVAYNGSKVVDVETGEEVFNQQMSAELCKRILHHMKNFDVRPLIVKGDYAYVTDVYQHMVKFTHHGQEVEVNIMAHESHDNGYMLCEVKDLEEFCDVPLNKILNIGDPEYLQAHYKEMAEPFLEEANSMFTASFYYEFTDKGIDKVAALDEVLQKRGYSKEEMIAFGDAQNDATMLQYAKIGVAMGNAIPELKEIADDVTASCEEDGIAKSLEKWL